MLEVAHSIFLRWRPLFQSNELNREVLHVVETFGEPFIQMLNVRERYSNYGAGRPADRNIDRSPTSRFKQIRTMRPHSRVGSKP